MTIEHRVEKQIELKAPVARVWRALTDYREFGEWFRVKLDGPFVPGRPSTGHITWPGYEHIKWEAVVVEMDPKNTSRTHGILMQSIRILITRRRRPRWWSSRWRRRPTEPCCE